MKRIFYVFLLLTACNGSTKTASDTKTAPEAKHLDFNGFQIGITSDSIENALGFAPSKLTRDEMEYNDVTYEGIKGNVKYNMAGGMLVSANFLETAKQPSSYDKLKTQLTNKFGNPTQENNDTMIWETDAASIYASKGKGGVYVDYSRKTTPGPAFKPLPK